MHNKHIHAMALPLLALLLTIFAPQVHSAPSEPNAILEASHEGLAYMELEFRPKSDKDPLRFQFKGSNGEVVAGITLPAEAADYEIIAFGTDGKVTHFGKGSIPTLLDGDRPLQLTLPPANPEEGKSDRIEVSLSRERLVLEAKPLDEPNNFTVHLEVTDPRGNPVKLDPNAVSWGLTDPTQFELLPLKERFEVVVRPREDGGLVIWPGALCVVPPNVTACVPNGKCRTVPVCKDPWVAISAGHAHTCALKSSGAAYCWGDNSAGALGARFAKTCGSFGPTCSEYPIRVECPAGAPCRFSNIAAGTDFTVATDINGDTWSWGSGARTHTKVSAANGTKRLLFERITAGNGHGCGIVKGGDLWCWGNNLFGQAGAGLPMSTVPLDSAVRVLSAFKFAKVAAARDHTCATNSAGDGVVCWGRDDQNQVRGPSSSAFPLGGSQFFFQHFGGFTPILDVAVSGTSSCATLGNGNGVRCWGANASLDLRPIGTPDQFAVGWAYACALSARQASCLGANASGQLGIGWSSDQDSPVTPHPPPTEFESISTGTAHTCGITPSGDAYCWGRTWEGQIGTGENIGGAPEPKLVTVP
jgi:alpha-tubulin suppressor-like RCC1 family protein